MRQFAAIIGALVIVGAIAFAGWHIKRWFNYNFGYSSDVQTTLCDMVKREALIDPTQCD